MAIQQPHRMIFNLDLGDRVPWYQVQEDAQLVLPPVSKWSKCIRKRSPLVDHCA